MIGRVVVKGAEQGDRDGNAENQGSGGRQPGALIVVQRIVFVQDFGSIARPFAWVQASGRAFYLTHCLRRRGRIEGRPGSHRARY